MSFHFQQPISKLVSVLTACSWTRMWTRDGVAPSIRMTKVCVWNWITYTWPTLHTNTKAASTVRAAMDHNRIDSLPYLTMPTVSSILHGEWKKKNETQNFSARIALTRISFSIDSFPNGSNRLTGAWLQRKNQTRLFNTRDKFIALRLQYVIIRSKFLRGKSAAQSVSNQRIQR